MGPMRVCSVAAVSAWSLRSRSATVAAGRPAKIEQIGPSKSRSR